MGNYRVSMGMGLVMNSDFSLGKVAMLQSLGRSTHRGVAATVNLGKGFKMTAFGSYRPMDATLNADETAATILTSDYHRTETEMNKKHNLQVTKAGGSLRYEHQRLHLGANALYAHLDKPLRPTNRYGRTPRCSTASTIRRGQTS